jgi:hypothetical protein
VLSVEELREQRPSEPGFARVLLITAAVLWLPVTGHLYAATSTGSLAALAVLLVVFGAFGAVKGRRAGRVMATVAIGVTYWFLLAYCVVGFRDPYPYSSVYAVLDIVAVLLSVVALTRLYHPKTSRYIHLVETARRSG